MKFILEIELGNDAMRTYSHIRAALKQAAAQTMLGCNLANDSSGVMPHVEDGTSIRDENGNTVGKWEVTED